MVDFFVTNEFFLTDTTFLTTQNFLSLGKKRGDANIGDTVLYTIIKLTIFYIFLHKIKQTFYKNIKLNKQF